MAIGKNIIKPNSDEAKAKVVSSNFVKSNISQQDYWLRPNETYEDYTRRIASVRGDTEQEVQSQLSQFTKTRGQVEAEAITKTPQQVLQESTQAAQKAAQVSGQTFTPKTFTTPKGTFEKGTPTGTFSQLDTRLRGAGILDPSNPSSFVGKENALQFLSEQQAQNLLERVSSSLGNTGFANLQTALQKRLGITPLTPTEIGTSDDLDASGVEAPTFTADGVASSNAIIGGMEGKLETSKNNLDKFYKDQLKVIQDQQKASQSKIDALTSKQEGLITGEIENTLKPFREELEKSERQRLKLEENYFANQQSIQELETLTTQAQAEVQAQREITGLVAIRNPRIAKITEDMSARVGVIEAVMAARNNQISVAEGLIDRSINAITADRQDQLNYYNTLLNFYQTKKDEEGNKILSLNKNEEKFINAQVSLLQNDLEQAQANVNYIKGLMLDPDTANVLEKSGVLLTDTPQQIQSKMAQYAYTEEVREQSNDMSAQGYRALAPTETKPQGEIITLTDSRGNTKRYWKKPEDKALSVSEAKALGVPFGTTESQAAGITPPTPAKETKEITADDFINMLGGIEVLRDSLSTKGFLGIGKKIATDEDVNEYVNSILTQINSAIASGLTPSQALNKFVEFE